VHRLSSGNRFDAEIDPFFAAADHADEFFLPLFRVCRIVMKSLQKQRTIPLVFQFLHGSRFQSRIGGRRSNTDRT
jgi:hypothetical protein